MDIIKYSSKYKNEIIEFLLEIIVDEFGLTDLEDYIRNKDFDAFLKPENNFLICLDNGKIVGTCGVLDIGDNTGKLNSFYMKKEYRNKGFGKLLFVKQEFFIAHGFSEVICCNNERFNSLNFYLTTFN